MATLLKNLMLTSVDLVRAGANQEADICLYKSADPQEATEAPTEQETNIFKRFINWLRENPAEAESEAVEKTEEPTEESVEKDYSTFSTISNNQQTRQKLWDYADAYNTSIRSIMDDNELTPDRKLQMMNQSLDEYSSAMRELFYSLCNMKESGVPVLAKSADEEDLSYLTEGLEKSYTEEEPEELEKADRFDDIEEVN